MVRATSRTDVPPSSTRRRPSATCAARQLGRPPEAHAPSPGRGPTRARPLVDQRPLELGDPGEHGQHHPAGRRGRVGPGLAQRAQAGAGVAQQLGDLQEVAGRAGEAVEPGHDDDVALPDLVEQAGELGPVAPRAGDLLLVEALAPRLLQGRALEREVLVVGGHARVADEHEGSPATRPSELASSRNLSQIAVLQRYIFATALALGDPRSRRASRNSGLARRSRARHRPRPCRAAAGVGFTRDTGRRRERALARDEKRERTGDTGPGHARLARSRCHATRREDGRATDGFGFSLPKASRLPGSFKPVFPI